MSSTINASSSSSLDVRTIGHKPSLWVKLHMPRYDPAIKSLLLPTSLSFHHGTSLKIPQGLAKSTGHEKMPRPGPLGTLQDLPLEVRYQIYEVLVKTQKQYLISYLVKEGCPWSIPTNHPILGTSQAIRCEALSVLFRKGTFSIDVATNSKSNYKIDGIQQTGPIQDLEITVDLTEWIYEYIRSYPSLPEGISAAQALQHSCRDLLGPFMGTKPARNTCRVTIGANLHRFYCLTARWDLLLKIITDALKGFTGFRRLMVDYEYSRLEPSTYGSFISPISGTVHMGALIRNHLEVSLGSATETSAGHFRKLLEFRPRDFQALKARDESGTGAEV